MTIECEMQDGIVYTKIRGVLDRKMSIDHIDALADIWKTKNQMRELVDLNEVNRINLYEDDIRAISKHAKMLNSEQGYRLACLASEPLPYGMARMYQAFAEMADNGTIVEVFRDRETAIKFLMEC